MINIALLHYSCPPIVGGVEEVVRQQASLFHRYFHPVKVLSGSGGGFSEDYPIELHPLFGSGNPEINQLHENASQNLPKILDLAAKIQNQLISRLIDFDILIAHNVLTMPYNLPLTFALHQLAESRTIRIVSWNHDSPYFYPDYDKKLDREPWTILKKYNPDIRYTTISHSRADEFRSLFGITNPLPVIPNGIDPIRFFRLSQTSVRLIQDAGLFDTDLILVQPSRLHPRKNIELSIRVLKELHQMGIEAKLLLTGAYDPHEPGTLQYHEQLIRMAQTLKIRDHLIILADHQLQSGQKFTTDRVFIRDLYLISDLLFLPSKMEGFGIPLLEAGMIKLPIVCSDIPPFKSIAGDDVCYFSLDDPPADIARTVVEFLSRLKPHQMFRNVIRNYVWDNIYHNTLLPFLKNVME